MESNAWTDRPVRFSRGKCVATQVFENNAMKLKVKFLIYALLITGTCLSGCKKAQEQGPEAKFSTEQLKARFYYDLGDATVDVSKYPEEIQRKYKTFLAVCSVCHTSARALNSPYLNAADWKRFMQRMHLRMENSEIPLNKKQEKEIVEFLTYDGKIRKVDGKAAFEARQAELKKLFDEVTSEQSRLMLKEQEAHPKKEFHDTGVK